jgi:parallel beta-helix repeat protein
MFDPNTLTADANSDLALNSLSNTGIANKSTSSTNQLFVSPYGDNNNSGSFSEPFKDIQHAIEQIGDGDGGTINLLGGTYTPSEGIFISGEHDGSANSRLVIRPYENAKVAIDGSQMSPGEKPFTNLGGELKRDGILIRGEYVDITGLEIKNIRGFNGIGIQEGGKHVRVLDNTVHNTQMNGIASFGSLEDASKRVSDITIDGNTVYRTNLYKGANKNNESINWGAGISLAHTDNSKVTNNTVYEGYGEGMNFVVTSNNFVANNTVRDHRSINLYLDTTTNTTVEKNFVYTSGNSEYFGFGNKASSNIQLANEDYDDWVKYDRSPYFLNNNKILNNILVGGRESIRYGTYGGFGKVDERIFNGMKNTVFANNTVYNDEGWFVGIDKDPNTSNVSFINNIFSRPKSSEWMTDIDSTQGVTFKRNLWDGGDNFAGDAGAERVLMEDDVKDDPMFVRAGGLEPENYQLQTNSPAIAKGISLDSVTDDFFGDKRPQNGTPDIGADEV